MSMCVSTAQARTKRCPGIGVRHFSCQFPHTMALMKISTAQACTKCASWSWDRSSSSTSTSSYSSHHFLRHHHHHHHHLHHHHHHHHHHRHRAHHDHHHPYCSAVSFCPPTLFGVSCRDNFFSVNIFPQKSEKHVQMLMEHELFGNISTDSGPRLS